MSTNQFCYAITVGDKTKIGLSKDPESRIRSVLTQSGIKFNDAAISIISVENMRACEKACHQYLSDVRAYGEWFTVSHQVAVDAIKLFSLEGIGGCEDRKQMSLRNMEAVFSVGFRSLWERQIKDTISAITASGCDIAIAEVIVSAAAGNRSLYELSAFFRGAGEAEVDYLGRLFASLEMENKRLLALNVEFIERALSLVEHGEAVASSLA